MAKELRVLTTLIADPTSVPLNHIRKLTTICNSSSMGIQCGLQEHVHSYAQTHT